jgi:hypothetical protein
MLGRMRKPINYCGSYFGSLEEVTRWRLAQSRDRAHTHQYGLECSQNLHVRLRDQQWEGD